VLVEDVEELVGEVGGLAGRVGAGPVMAAAVAQDAVGLAGSSYGQQHDNAGWLALGAYRRVQAHEFDDHTYIDPTATYVLAQARMKALGK
jgi:hypothetical protein